MLLYYFKVAGVKVEMNNIIFLIFSVGFALVTAQSNQHDIEVVILDGIIRGASQENQQLLQEPSLSLAADLFRTIFTQVITYNLAAIENIAQTSANCAVDPSQRSRNILESSRDKSLTCLRQFRATMASREYSECLKQNTFAAKNDIDALKPIIDACLATLATPNGNAPGVIAQPNLSAAVATAVNVNVLVNAIVQQHR